MAKQLYTIDLASSRGGGDSLGSAFPLLVPRVISRVIFALFSRYFALFLRHPARLLAPVPLVFWSSLPRDSAA
jgi:hypothetical protein